MNGRRLRLGATILLCAATSMWAQQPLVRDPLLPLQIHTGVLTPDQPQAEASFEVDSTVRRIHLDIAATAADLEVTLHAPNGRAVTAQTAAGLGGEYSYFYFDRDVSIFWMTLWSRGHHYAYRLPTLGAGSYTVRVRSRLALSEPVALVFEFSADSTRVSPAAAVRTRLTLDAPGMAALLDEPNRLVVSAREDEAPVTGSVVSVEIQPEGGSATSISLLDDGQDADRQAGDGLYSGWFTPRATGQYQATAHIQLPARYQNPAPTNPPPGATITSVRLEFTYFPVVRQGGRLTGRIADRGVDEDGDRRFDKVVFDVEVDVKDEGEYSVDVLLGKDGMPGPRGHQTARLTPGLRTVSVSIDVDTLHDAGLDFPYQIRTVSLSRRSAEGAHTVSEVENAAETKPYRAAEMRKPRMAVTGAVSDRGIDDDGDGLFEWLAVYVPLEVRRDHRHYSWEAELAAANGRVIQTAFGSGQFEFEQNIAELKFDTGGLRRAGIPGPYTVRNFKISRPDHSLEIASLGKTQPYSLTQFGGRRARLTEVSHSTVHLGEEARVGVVGEGTNFQQSRSSVTVTPPLGADEITVMDPSYLTFRLRVGRNAAAGPRSITVRTADESVRLENAFTVTSAPAPPPEVVEAETPLDSTANAWFDGYAKLTGRLQERLIDENADGLGEALALDVEASILKPGKYHARARLTPSDGVVPTSRVMTLEPGTHWLSIIVPEERLYRLGESFQFTMREVELVLDHEKGSPEVSKITNPGQTRRYQLSEFEPPVVAIAGEAAEEAVDDNGDGLFDRLVVSIPVEKRREERSNNVGWSGRLEGPSGKVIQYFNRSAPLKAGIHPLRLEFDGAKIRKANLDGPFFVRRFSVNALSARVSVDQLIETRAYRVEQFQPPRPQVLSVTPVIGRPGESVTVEIRGYATSFSAGESRVAAGESIAANADYVAGAELLRTTFRIDPQATPGPRNVTVTTGSETATLAEGFRVLGPGETGHELGARKPPPKGKLIAELRDRGVDDDGNGLFEGFVIEVDAELEQAGEYSVVLYLQHNNGEFESLPATQKVEAGRRTFRVSFPAFRLHAMPEDTPYTVQQVVLRFEGGRGSAHMDRLKPAWKTKQYRAADFEPARLVIAQAEERGVDDDGDGLYDRLAVSVPVEIRRETDPAAQYSWALGLTDQAGKYVDVVRGEGVLKPGVNQIELSFAAEKIRSFAADGPYRLGTFLLKAADGSVLMERVGITRAYSASQFRAPPAAGAGR